jgi:hypothetical protein
VAVLIRTQRNTDEDRRAGYMGRLNLPADSPTFLCPAAAAGFPVTPRSVLALGAGSVRYGIDTQGKGAVTILHHQCIQGFIP